MRQSYFVLFWLRVLPVISPGQSVNPTTPGEEQALPQVKQEWMGALKATSRLRIVTSLLCFYLLFPAIGSGQTASRDSVQRASLDQETLDLFAGYPQSNDLQDIIYSHARREPLEQSSAALYSTWFRYGSPHAVMATIVYTDGRVYTYLLRKPDRRRDWKELPAVDLPLFMATLKALPGSMPSIALADLVIVSFRLDGKWQTRLYDRKKAPVELIKIYQLAHSVLDGN